MSQPISAAETLYIQRVCAVCGFYTGPLNGVWDLATEQAEAKLFAADAQIKTELGGFDARTEKNILTLMPPAQRIARRFMRIAAEFPLTVRIISGSRTYAEQDALFAIGRTTQLDRGKVTNAKGGESNHNFGIAWDVGIFEAGGRYMDGSKPGDEKAYRDLAAKAKPAIAELEWGGDWTTFKDRPHYQVRTGKTTKEVRELFEDGKNFLP